MSTGTGTGTPLGSFSSENPITSAAILARVNKICKRNETDIDDILIEVLQDLAKRTLVLKTVATGYTTANQAYISKPDGMIDNVILALEVGGMKLDPISWSQYINNNFKGYCVYGNAVYLRPNPTAAEAYSIYYPQYHSSEIDTILFPEDFRSAIVHGVAAKVYEKYERYDAAALQITMYEQELLKLDCNSTPDICENNSQET